MVALYFDSMPQLLSVTAKIKVGYTRIAPPQPPILTFGGSGEIKDEESVRKSDRINSLFPAGIFTVFRDEVGRKKAFRF